LLTETLDCVIAHAFLSASKTGQRLFATFLFALANSSGTVVWPSDQQSLNNASAVM
jgi:hypothetical protein